MAYELQIRNSETPSQDPQPRRAAALLPIVTLGIYHLVWWYRHQLRAAATTGAPEDTTSVRTRRTRCWAVFLGALIIVPALHHLLAWDQASTGGVRASPDGSRSTAGSR